MLQYHQVSKHNETFWQRPSRARRSGCGQGLHVLSLCFCPSMIPLICCYFLIGLYLTTWEVAAFLSYSWIMAFHRQYTSFLMLGSMGFLTSEPVYACLAVLLFSDGFSGRTKWTVIYLWWSLILEGRGRMSNIFVWAIWVSITLLLFLAGRTYPCHKLIAWSGAF